MSGPLRHIAPILSGFTVFGSQICSQMSRLAGAQQPGDSGRRACLDPTLPVAGRSRDQARYVRFRAVGDVVEGPTVVTVVVRNVVIWQGDGRRANRSQQATISV